jgi:Putative DNA-binding domain
MTLLTLQRSMRDHLIGGADKIKAQIRGDASLRLAVYHHAYRSQLLDCLRDSFERVWAWLGDTGFEAAARMHIESHPPRSWTMSAYGDDFDRTLSGLYPDDPEVAELAWLDWSLRRAFDGPDATPIPPEALSGIDWDSAILRILPTLRMTSISTNSAAIWTALSEKNAPPAAARLHAPTALRVWRKEFSPHFRAVDSIEQQALLMACDGSSFAAICSVIAARMEPAEAPEIAGALLASWLRDGLIIAVESR